MALLQSLREEVLDAVVQMRDYGLVVMAGGTFSARDPETGLVVITPSGMTYDGLVWQDMVVIDENLNKVEGDRKPSICSDMFMKIYKARPEINGVAHSHSRYATAFASCNLEIPVTTTTQANLVGGPVPCTSFVHPDPHNDRYLDDIVATIGKGYACNIRNHGPVVCGHDVYETLENIVTVEVTAEITAIARQLGTPYALNPDETLRSYNFCKTKVGQH